jgi:putative spermidine/putrescine transport system substrate-binding protein
MSDTNAGADAHRPARGTTRRRLLQGTAAFAGVTAASGAFTGFPTIWAQNIKDVVLHQAGSPVAAIPKIAEQANKDLGFNRCRRRQHCVHEILGWTRRAAGDSAQQIQVLGPNHPSLHQGYLSEWCRSFDSRVAPYTVLYATGPDGQKFANGPTEWVTGIPTITNADTLGIRPDLIGRPITSCADLISPELKGKATLNESPTTGVIDVAMAVEARGAVKYRNKGNMTRDEIDKTINLMIEIKRSGHFRSFWTTFDQSVNLMASGEVVIQSMISPAVTAVRTRGIPCVFQPLREGYRGWGTTLAPMKHLSGLKLDCFYEYMNWYTSGFQGAFIARQGYYSGVPENAKKFLTEAEWDYWYGGKPAATDITDPYGKLMEKAGRTRDGGVFRDRMGNIAV